MIIVQKIVSKMLVCLIVTRHKLIPSDADTLQVNYWDANGHSVFRSVEIQ